MLPDNILFQTTDGPEAPEAEWARSVLSAEEQARAGRFHFDRDRLRWTAGRAWVRAELGRRLGCAPEAVPLAAEPGGRLYVPDAPFDFNLSHTGGWIALGFCQQDCRIGVDLETIDPAFPALEIAEEFFLPEEHAWTAAGPIARFFHLWTAKEALMKATGRGMSLEPDKIQSVFAEDALTAVRNLEDGRTHPVITQPGPGSTVLSAVVIR